MLIVCFLVVAIAIAALVLRDKSAGPLPELASVDFIHGRPANAADVAEGRAAFTTQGDSVAVEISLPQYALHCEGQRKTPCVVIQAEEVIADGPMKGARLFGCRVGGHYLVGKQDEFELLGTAPSPFDRSSK